MTTMTIMIFMIVTIMNIIIYITINNNSSNINTIWASLSSFPVRHHPHDQQPTSIEEAELVMDFVGELASVSSCS